MHTVQLYLSLYFFKNQHCMGPKSRGCVEGGGGGCLLKH